MIELLIELLIIDQLIDLDIDLDVVETDIDVVPDEKWLEDDCNSNDVHIDINQYIKDF